MTRKIITANTLTDGLSVFLSSDGHWSSDITRSDIAENESQADELRRRAEASERAQIVVGPYLIDVEENRNGLSPTRLRERIRVQGPSIETQIQTEQTHVPV